MRLRCRSPTLTQAAPLVQERIKTLPEATDFLAFLCKDEIVIDDPARLIHKKMDAASTAQVLRAVYNALAALDGFDPQEQEDRLRALADEMGLKAGQVFGTLRDAVTAQRVSPPLFDTMALLARKPVWSASRLLPICWNCCKGSPTRLPQSNHPICSRHSVFRLIH